MQLEKDKADNFTADRTVDGEYVVCHLHMITNISLDGQIYVYCKECEGIAIGRQILICSKCNEVRYN